MQPVETRKRRATLVLLCAALTVNLSWPTRLAFAAGNAGAAAAPAAAAPAVGTPAPATAGVGSVKNGVREIDWEALLPKDYRSTASGAGGPPVAIHDYLGEAAPAAQQVADFSVNKELNGVAVKLPGFIVPLDVGKDGIVSEFFLVPYFGACIHVPPPPPNQIVYVRAAKGVALDSIYEAYWITGRMSIQKKDTRLGASAYQLDAEKVEIYKY